MKIINKRILVVTLAVITAMLAIVLVRQKTMIAQYCDISEDIVGMNTDIEYEGYLISVTKASVWNVPAYYEYLGPEYEDLYISSDVEASVVELTVHIERTEEAVDSNHGFWDFSLVSGAYVSGYDLPAAQKLNEEYGDMVFDDIERGEGRDYVVPYCIYEDGFTEAQWNNRDSLSYELLLDIYPEKKAIMLNTIENHMDFEYEDTAAVSESETVQTTEESAAEADNRISGYDEIENIYDVGSCAVIDGVQYTISNAGFVYNLEEITAMPDTGIYSSLYPSYRDNYFDAESGECLSEMDSCFVKYTVNVNNLTDKTKMIDVGACSIVNETNYSTKHMSALLYSTEYNREAGDEHRTYMMELQAGESLSYTIIGVLGGYDNYEKEKMYCEIFILGYDVEADSFTNDMYGCYIELDMRGSDTDG